MVEGNGFDSFRLSSEVGDTSQSKNYVKFLGITFGIGEAYPNPFNPVTSFSYNIPEDGMVNVAVYDINGRQVDELVNGFRSAGSYPVVWNANNLSSGVYMIQMHSGNFASAQKIMLIK